MAYSLRSRRDPPPRPGIEQTDIPASNPTELQTTANFPQAVPLKLDEPQDSTLPNTLTDQTFPTPEPLQIVTLKPEVEIVTTDCNITGPVRVEPTLQYLATLPVETSTKISLQLCRK